MEAAHCERWSTAKDRTRHQNIWPQQPGDEVMTEHCEDRTCSGGPVTAEPDRTCSGGPVTAEPDRTCSGGPVTAEPDRTCSGGPVTAEPAEQSPPRPCVSPDPSRGVVQGQDLDLQVQDTESSRGGSYQETSAMLVCKQPMQLQQSGAITTLCRGAGGGEGGAPPPRSRCSCISPTKTDHLPPRPPPPCDQAVCCGSYVHNANFYHTLAAYCHPHPIPAPAPLLPRLEPPCTTQRAVAPPAASAHLSLPRLMSSVSETGLDTKHLLRCCNLSCTWSGTPPPGPPPPGPPPSCQPPRACCRSPAGAPIWSRDKGTMTTTTVLRDVGVQTSQTGTPHVFPHICLADDSRSDTSAAKTPTSDRNEKQGGAPKSPVKEVKWDAEGMTWEVYGASVDPEELGLAIQKHLELQIKETSSRAAKLARQDTNTSRQTGSAHKRSRLVASFRGPDCCSRRTSAKD